jgi:hypothetical protein
MPYPYIPTGYYEPYPEREALGENISIVVPGAENGADMNCKDCWRSTIWNSSWKTWTIVDM